MNKCLGLVLTLYALEQLDQQSPIYYTTVKTFSSKDYMYIVHGYNRRAVHQRICQVTTISLTGCQRRRGLHHAQYGLPRALARLPSSTHSGGAITHQEGADSSSESTGQPGQPKLQAVVPAGLWQQNLNLKTRTHVWPADIAWWTRHTMTRDHWH